MLNRTFPQSLQIIKSKMEESNISRYFRRQPRKHFIHQIDGGWDISKDRNLTFALKSRESIDNLVKDL